VKIFVQEMPSAWAMPIIVLNMGGEMVYILHQRLMAQTVNNDKANKVLQEVVKAMFSTMFIEELFKPQEQYSSASTRQIFEKLAHSSIMRLNKVSMDKLYDLMSMGFKYQILSLKSPQQYMQLTLVHLEKLKELVKTEAITELIDSAIRRLIATYSVLTNGQWLILKQSIMRFMQGKRIKVSLFLQQNLQTMNGVLVLNNSGSLPYGTDIPGHRKLFEGGKLVSVQSISCPQTLEVVQEAVAVLDVDNTLGSNMYMVDATSASKSVPESLVVANAALMSSAASSDGLKKATLVHSTKVSSSSAKQELTLLADLLGFGGEKRHEDEKPFKINLFPDSRGFDDKDSDAKDEGGNSGFIMIDIDGTAGGKTFDEYLRDLDLKDDAKVDLKDEGKAEDDDLLALMDSAK
jgi:hypothetical protein